MERPEYDAVVIGGGIVGLAAAMALTASRRLSLAVLEAADRVAAHQTGHNTGIIHSGVFYRPGTLKAQLCVEGQRALYRFCQEHGLAHERCGVTVLATGERDLPGLRELKRWGDQNGLIGVEWLDQAEIWEHEPHARGVAGLFVPEAGIVDYAEVARAYADRVRAAGGMVLTGARVLTCRRQHGAFQLETPRGPVRGRFLVNCAGLQSDRVARLCGVDPGVQIIPFRGQYYALVPDRRFLVRNLIYPVPDLSVPFLGMHLTRTVHGEVEADPNGALTFDREGYELGSFSPEDAREMLSYSGFWLMVGKHLGTGLTEALRAVSRRAFWRPLQRMVPELRPEDLRRTRAGIHAQAVEPDGTIVDDFRLLDAEGMVHVLNATSPAASASIALGTAIAARVAAQIALPFASSGPGEVGAAASPGAQAPSAASRQ